MGAKDSGHYNKHHGKTHTLPNPCRQVLLNLSSIEFGKLSNNDISLTSNETAAAKQHPHILLPNTESYINGNTKVNTHTPLGNVNSFISE
jgi:hypothetical protein